MASTPGVRIGNAMSLADLRRYITKTPEYQKMQDASADLEPYQKMMLEQLEKHKAMGSGTPLPPDVTMIASQWVDYSGPLGTSAMYPSSTTYMYVDVAEYEALKASVSELEKTASKFERLATERQEIIEALSADMEDIEFLKAENESLKAELEKLRDRYYSPAIAITTTTVTSPVEYFPALPSQDGGEYWMLWRVPIGDSFPTPIEGPTDVQTRDGSIYYSGVPQYFNWSNTGGMCDIVSYRRSRV